MDNLIYVSQLFKTEVLGEVVEDHGQCSTYHYIMVNYCSYSVTSTFSGPRHMLRKPDEYHPVI